MTKDEVMTQLAKYGSESTKKTLMKHGAREPFFGVKVQDLKVLQKKIKKDYILALELFDTGNSDAMYLAALIADETKMTKNDLNNWAKKAYWSMLSEYAVAWVTSESKPGFELALEWIDSKDERIASTGWATLSSLVGIKPDAELDLKLLEKLIGRVEKEIKAAPNRVRYTMNVFLISAGSYVVPLTTKARQAAKKIGVVMVDMGGTACKVPDAAAYIDKVESKRGLGKKRKEARC
jgi:3-methyladenine DNA glycosylase AlkD